VRNRLTERPQEMAIAGALTIAFSSILVRAAHVSPSTAAIFRCAYAVPLLYLLARREDRRLGSRPARSRRLAGLAGGVFAVDLISWHHSIADVGAGLATVFGNLQVVFVPVIAWVVLRERPGTRALTLLPGVFAGIVLISGVLESHAYGRDPGEGVLYGTLTGLTYAVFLLLLRAGGADLRRPAGPLFDATAAATVGSVIGGVLLGEADLAPHWPAHGYLLALALSSQVLGWLLIASSLPRLPAATASILLTVQPVGSVLLGAAIFAESPSLLQLAGVVVVLACLVAIARSVRAPRDAGGQAPPPSPPRRRPLPRAS